MEIPEPAVSRVLSRTIIHLGQSSPTASSNLPGSPLGTGGGRSIATPLLGALRFARTPLFGLAPGGVYRAASCYQSRGALLPHLFTLTNVKPAVSFLWHFPWARAPQVLPGALSEGARTFLCHPKSDSDCLACSGISGARFYRKRLTAAHLMFLIVMARFAAVGRCLRHLAFGACRPASPVSVYFGRTAPPFAAFLAWSSTDRKQSFA